MDNETLYFETTALIIQVMFFQAGCILHERVYQINCKLSPYTTNSTDKPRLGENSLCLNMFIVSSFKSMCD